MGPPAVERPAGFPKCPTCALVDGGPLSVCYGCASATFDRVSSPCPICTRETYGQPCGNPLCRNAGRSVARIDAVAVKTGPLDSTIKRLKYDGKHGWAVIFGRLVAGYLQVHRQPSEFDIIVANPTFVGAGSERINHHTEMVIDAAAREDTLGTWPFDQGSPRAIVKTAPTPRSAAPGTTYPRKVAAADALLSVLHVPELERIRGASVLVYDDICTTGLQLDRVAQVLRGAGAAHVEGLVLARTPYRPR